MAIPFNKPFIVGNELSNIAKAVAEYNDISGGGRFTAKCQEWLETSLNCNCALLTHSCTAALEMAALLCDVQPGDEIILPSFTFVSTANAFALRGGVPVFIDIKEETLNIDENLIDQAITARTKVIVPVHYAGIPCELNVISQLAEEKNILVVEDAAQALLSSYNGKFLGTIGDIGAFSFHETKNIISGEGGAILINNEKLVERARVLWEKGTNRPAFLNGEIDKYTWVDLGSSFQPSEIISAFLFAQLEKADQIICVRRRHFELYYQLLRPLLDKEFISLPRRDHGNGHIFYIITKSFDERTQLIRFLREKGIQAVFHYIPLHSSPGGQKYGRVNGALPVTDELSGRLLRLPMFYEMDEGMVCQVVQALDDFYLKNHTS